MAFIISFFATALKRLLHCVGGYYTKHHRHLRLNRCLHDAGGCLPGDVVEMRRVASDYDAERDDGIITAASGSFDACQRQLERARNMEDLDRTLCCPGS